jgi:hypothetical protein
LERPNQHEVVPLDHQHYSGASAAADTESTALALTRLHQASAKADTDLSPPSEDFQEQHDELSARESGRSFAQLQSTELQRSSKRLRWQPPQEQAIIPTGCNTTRSTDAAARAGKLATSDNE